ncbi:MAG: CinA family protein, partial [Lachnospiraceae bacterium]|nr:CinA family protein [Lachnospiraceae bacterium]
IGVTVQKKTVVKEFHFSGDRQEIRSQAVTEALALLRLALLKIFSEITFS